MKKGGTKNEKTSNVAKHVLQMFQASSSAGHIIHDMDIRKWALEGASLLSEDSIISEFKAGKTWIQKFKKDNGIVFF